MSATIHQPMFATQGPANMQAVATQADAMQADAQTSAEIRATDVAIIGIAGRFPGAPDLDTFWANLCAGVESISFFSDEELLDAGIDPALLQQPNYVKACGVVAEIEQFDAAFFGFSPREAALMDPQQRLFLECAYTAIENAGYASESYEGSIGVYAGATISNYFLNNLYANRALMDSAGFQVMISNGHDFLSTTVSYKLNLKGPSVNIQTACSTSLVAIHLACQSLQNGECDMALAGAASLLVPTKTGYLYEEGMILSPDGHCRAFDAKAQGTVGGSGVAVVLLKSLDEALADGDPIYAVIKGSAINNDGADKVGYTAPSVQGQAAIIAEAQMLAGVSAANIGLLEAHGTGTILGDPIEVQALTQVFRASTDKNNFCALGSVKTNIGHADTAAGIAGLLKATLALHHKQLPPSLHFEQPNPQIDFANSPFFVNVQLKSWQSAEEPRMAGVSSFGIGGTNAHVVLAEAPASHRKKSNSESNSEKSNRPWQVLPFSAKTPTALAKATANFSQYVKAHPALSLADAAYTLSLGRNHFDYRSLLLCDSPASAIQAIESPEHKGLLRAQQLPQPRRIAFMCSGQGAQYVNMARQLYECEPTFRKTLDHCCTLLQPHLGLDLRSILYPTVAEEALAATKLLETALAQPALFVVEYALATLWIEWIGQPQALIGHSIGEYVAACLAGVFSLEDALKLVAQRGKLMQQTAAGAMLSVPLSAAALQEFLADGLALAAINAPALCVVAGTEAAIEQLQQQLHLRQIESRRLHTSHAFHSPMMEPILSAYQKVLCEIQLHPPEIPLLSNLTGDWLTAQEAIDPAYWQQHLRQTVLFAQGVQKLMQDTETILLEVGPGRGLSTFALQQPGYNHEQIVLASLRHPQDVQPDCQVLATTLGKLWLAGVEINWQAYFAHENRLRLPLPTYAFDHQRYWIDAPSRQPNQAERNAAQNLPAIGSRSVEKESDIARWFYLPSWKRSLLLPERNADCTFAGNWLLFGDPGGLAMQLAQQLQQQGASVVLVSAGDTFTSHSSHHYQINPNNPSHYTTLFQTLTRANQLPQTILHFWNFASPSGNQLSPSQGTVCTPDGLPGFYTLIWLCQALGLQNEPEPIRLFAISNSLHRVTGEEVLLPQNATILGPLKVIGQEFPHIQTFNIDFAVHGDFEANQPGGLLSALCAELSTNRKDRTVAWRHGQRWVQLFEPVALPQPDASKLPLRLQGAYLITGGLGEIGLLLAEYLARTVQAKLVLTARSALPMRGDWAQWLASHANEDATSRKIRRLQKIELLGGSVLTFSANVSDFSAMGAVVAQAEAQFGAINAVIHAAGSVGDDAFQAIQEITLENCIAQFQPKIDGLLVLDAMLGNRSLDFCLLCSSLSAVLGGLGFASYAAANAFMDAFVQAKIQNGSATHWLTVNWDGWQFGESASAHGGLGSTVAALTIQPEEGIAAFERMLVYPQLKQVIVSTGNLEQRLAQWIAPSALDSRQPQQTANGAASHVRPVWLGEYVAPRNKIEESLGKIYSELLGIEAISIYDNFFELGGHSLLATQLLSRIRTVLHTQIALNKIFEHSSIASLAEQVAALQLAGQVRLPNSKVAANGTTHLGIDIEHNIEHTDIDPNVAPGVVLHVDYEEGIV